MEEETKEELKILEKEDKSLDSIRKNIQNQEENILKKEEKILEKEEKIIKQKEKRVLEKKEAIQLSKEADIFEERKGKVFNFVKKNPACIFAVLLILLVFIGMYIRYQPLADHQGVPGLWDYTAKDYTLGPDLDPFLFLRYARTMIENGSLPQIDTLRNVPLGFDTTTELQMVSYLIVLTYKVINIFGNYSINYAGAFMPVWAFGLTIIAFFFFVREIFTRKNEKESYLKANIIAIVSTLFMTIVPEFLSRTVAGIPEKESAAFLFMFLSFYLFLKAWKSEKLMNSCLLALLAGLSTAVMGLTWGGVSYAYITIALASLAAFLINKFQKKETLAYVIWLVSSFLITNLLTNRYPIKGFLTSTDTGFASLILGILIVHYILWNTKLSSISKIDQLKLPKTIISIIIAVVIGVILSTIISPTFIIDKANFISSQLIRPVTGRWSSTVAENRQPYFRDWFGSFGKAMFWMIFAGSVLLFYKMFDKIKKNDKIVLSGLYILFFFGLVFSRYASGSFFNGENFFSKLFYFGSALIFAAGIIYYYVRYHKENNLGFEQAEFEYILLFALFVLTLFTARSAVRLIMVLIPIALIFLAYILTESGYKMKQKENKWQTVWIMIFLVVLLVSAYHAYSYYNGIKSAAYNSIPHYGTIQWQNAMSWVRGNTPENAVFAHWWDYGYWVQSIGNRATVTDGGNAITWWNYLSGRYVLTGDNQKDALEFLWNHNATYFLIDPTDIGKYGAFSQIGSDENYDRRSGGPTTFLSSASQVQETKNETIRNYNIPAGNGQISVVGMEEDLVYEKDNVKKTMFKENSGVIGINIRYINKEGSIAFGQPELIIISEGKQQTLPMRYIYYNSQLFDFKSGVNAAIYPINKINQNSIESMGAAIYISPRLMRGMLSQVYVLNNSLGNFNNFEIAHSENDIFTDNLIKQGYDLGEFNYFYNVGLQGPIKIWKIKYTGSEKSNPEYLLKAPPAYITWSF